MMKNLGWIKVVILAVAVAAIIWFFWSLLHRPNPDVSPAAEHLIKDRAVAAAQRDSLKRIVESVTKDRDSTIARLGVVGARLDTKSRALRHATDSLDALARTLAARDSATNDTTAGNGWKPLYYRTRLALNDATEQIDSLKDLNAAKDHIIAMDTRAIVAANDYFSRSEFRMDSLETELDRANKKLRGPRVFGIPLPDACFGVGPSVGTDGHLSIAAATVGLCYRLRLRLH